MRFVIGIAPVLIDGQLMRDRPELEELTGRSFTGHGDVIYRME